MSPDQAKGIATMPTIFNRRRPTMEFVLRTRGVGYCRLVRARNEQGARQGAPKNQYPKRYRAQFSRTTPGEVRAPGT